ncbi:AcrR family transcriptional regulator [Actinoalloteichus hoggarensis]|uniref:Transcriptional regulator, TetR family n=1 Tax=Actinoalloteichus hoggarensis TaxID=1470176 RepID=A0A221W4A1_9PSEU|nr:TetR/AcrR family transcriptional regulator [Actinoalloteichus hoggarensis]ASO20476.1 Transcriptional regulator, TetR family [Actinoalloteichus hoggarensis]MBB5923516.1 AcrR family transcriptional regulator [Actinoalloteichus hoggarensis]
MPTPRRTSQEEIVTVARDILERHGPAHLTMQAVAERVGVRAPSLYKRVRNRDDLLRLATEATIRDLSEELHAIDATGDPRRVLGDLARTIRAFAHARPHGYHLVFTNASAAARPDPALLAEAAAPVLNLAAVLAGPEHALEAARTITAWTHGFISMELAGAFNLGGDVESAYEFGVDRLADALAR